MIIKTDNISFKYSKDEAAAQVLSGVNLKVYRGEFLCIVGHNGSGKSTLAKHLNALLIPDSGTVWVDEIDTSNEETIFKVRQRVGMVFQNPDNQLVATVVEEDVAFAPENLGIEPAKIRTRVDEALKAVNMYKRRKDAPHQLSGGQKQRVAIAGIIAMRPRCIVLDEPTAMLDPAGRDKVLRTIKKLNSEFGITIILITHFMAETIMADRVLVMKDGEMTLEGTPREVFSHPEIVVDAGLKLPQPTQGAVLLKELGFKIDTDILTTDELVDSVKKLLED